MGADSDYELTSYNSNKVKKKKTNSVNKDKSELFETPTNRKRQSKKKIKEQTKY